MSKQKNNNNISNNKESKAQKKAQQVVDAYVGKSQLKSDPMGSWTGKPQNPNDVPVQDADDL